MTISLAAALKLIETRCAPAAQVETVELGAAQGRVLAETIVAPIAVPAADNSAVDGYGFRHADLAAAHEGGLSLVGVAAAGRVLMRRVERGQAVRIFTGAVPPQGVDSIAMQEEVVRDGGRIVITGAVPLHANIRRAGEDIAQGAPVLDAGRILGPFALGMLASLGIAAIQVRTRLRVAVFSAGDELIDPGQDQRPGAIYDANRPILLALLTRLGIDAHDLGILPDDAAATRSMLGRAAAEHDAIVTSAGVSVGDEDHLRGAVETLGGLDFAAVAIKPGKPIAFGHVAGTPFFGLPGNPVAMALSFLLLARPGLLRLAGATCSEPRRFPVHVDFVPRHRPGRLEFLRCGLRDGPDGPVAVRFPHGGSGILSSMGKSEGLVELAEDLTEIAAGARLPYIPFSEFGL